MASRHAPLTLIVAMTSKGGIGKDGGLPWPMIKKEMAYFARVTQRVPKATQQDTNPASSDGSIRNVVIMGSKTWNGIPPKFRPLKNRTNVVISRSVDSAAFADARREGVIVANSIETALDELDLAVKLGKSPARGRVFVIGGASIYDTALDMPNTKHILVTKVSPDFECDTFFPSRFLSPSDDAASRWKSRGPQALCHFVEETCPDIQDDIDGTRVECSFDLYEKT